MNRRRVSNRFSDNTWRLLCRCAFLLFGLVPTVLTLYWIFHPQTAAGWQQQIQAGIGIATDVDSIECKGPYETILRGVSFHDPVHGPLLSATQVRVVRGDINQIVIESPVTVGAHGLSELLQQVQNHLSAARLGDKPWKIVFGKTTITADTQTTAVANQQEYLPSVIARSIVIDIQHFPDGTSADFDIFLESDITGVPVQAYLRRGSGTMKLRHEAGIDTGLNFLPTWLVDNVVPDLNHVGPDCMFAGKVHISPEDSGISGNMSGIFRQINLAAVVSPFGQQLTGMCDFQIENCEFTDGQIYSMSAVAMSRHGSMGLPLLDSAEKHLAVDIPENVLAPEIEFRNLFMTCLINHGELTLAGPSGGVIAWLNTGEDNSTRPLVVSRNPAPVRLLSLANFLVSPDRDGLAVYDERLVAVLRHFHMPGSPRIADRQPGEYR